MVTVRERRGLGRLQGLWPRGIHANHVWCAQGRPLVRCVGISQERYDECLDLLRNTLRQKSVSNRVGARVNLAPPTPPDVRVRIRRFTSAPEGDGRDR